MVIKPVTFDLKDEYDARYAIETQKPYEMK